MSLKRTWARNIARNRLADADFDHVNKRLGMRNDGSRISRRKLKRWMKTKAGTRRFNAYSRKYHPLWMRVTIGDLSDRALKAQIRAGAVREAVRNGMPVPNTAKKR